MRRPLNSLEKQLASFLKEQRNGRTYATFAKKVGLPPSTLFRIENGEQSATLKLVKQIMERLGVHLTDIFKGS